MVEKLNSVPEGGQEKITLEQAQDYFLNQPDFNEPKMVALADKVREGKFFEKAGEMSAEDLILEDIRLLKQQKEDALKNGNETDAQKYEIELENALKISEFLNNLSFEEKKKSEFSESDADKIIEAIKKDLKPEVLPKPGEITPEAKEQIKREAKEKKEEEKPESEFGKTGRQLMDFQKAWEKAAEISKKKGDKKELAKLSNEIIAIAEEMTRKNDENGEETDRRNLIEEVKEELGKKDDPGVLKTEEFKNLLTKKVQEIYEKKSGLYNTALKLLKNKETRERLKKIIADKKSAEDYDGKKVNGRLFLHGEDKKYYFEIAGKTYPVAEAKKLAPKPSSKTLEPSPNIPPQLVAEKDITEPSKEQKLLSKLRVSKLHSVIELPEIESRPEPEPEPVRQEPATIETAPEQPSSGEIQQVSAELDKAFAEKENQLDDTTLESDPLRGGRIKPPAEALPPKSAEPERELLEPLEPDDDWDDNLLMPEPIDLGEKSGVEIPDLTPEERKIYDEFYNGKPSPLSFTAEEEIIKERRDEILDRTDFLFTFGEALMIAIREYTEGKLGDKKKEQEFSISNYEDDNNEPIYLEGPAITEEAFVPPVKKKKRSWWQIWK